MKSHLTAAIVVLGALLLLMVTPAPAQMVWQQVVGDSSATAAGFGDANNRMVMSSVVHGEYLYTGTFNQETGTEIWLTASGLTWTRHNSDGFGGSDNASSYSMAVFANEVFAGTWASGIPETQGSDTRIWRFDSGSSWSQVNVDGFGDNNNAEPWAMAVFDNKLWVGVANYPDGAEIWHTPASFSWEISANGGFGDGNNIEITALAVFGGSLYAATRNEVSGLQVWRKTAAASWSQVNAGGFGGANHFAAYAMAVFNGGLYLSAFDFASGGTVYATADGTSWAQPEQAGGGFGDANNYGSYAMTVFDGALYLGTFNWATGTEVWQTTNGGGWTQVNSDGFGKSSNSAVFTWSELNGDLYAGVRNDGGCEVWRYTPLLFADGFESGNTSGWSASVP